MLLMGCVALHWWVLVRLARSAVLCYEALPGVDVAALEQRLRATARAFIHTVGIVDVLGHPGFPVDIRHNAKIGRERLAVWAAQRLRC